MYINALDEKIYYRFEQKTNLPLVVFIHGLGGVAQTGELYLKFPNRKYSLLCFDMVGRGKSSYHHKISVQFWMQNIKVVLKALKIKEFYILAHSFGGFLSCKLLLDKYFKINNSLLVAPYNPFVDAKIEFRQKIDQLYPLNQVNKKTSQANLIKMYHQINKNIAEEFLIKDAKTYWKDRDVMVDFATQQFYDITMKNAYQKANRFEIIAGQDDKIVPLESLKKLAKFKNKKLMVLEGAHDVIVTQANQINDYLNEMVTRST